MESEDYDISDDSDDDPFGDQRLALDRTARVSSLPERRTHRSCDAKLIYRRDHQDQLLGVHG